MGETKPGLVLAVDVGTTNLICHVFDKTGISKYGAIRKIQLLHPKPGWVEMNPNTLWEQFMDVVTETVEGANVRYDDIAAIGISTQRGTFLTFDNVPAVEICEQWFSTVFVFQHPFGDDNIAFSKVYIFTHDAK